MKRLRTCELAWLGMACFIAIAGCRGPEPMCADCFLNEAAFPIDSSTPPASDRTTNAEAATAVESGGSTGRSPLPRLKTGEPLQLPKDLPGADVPPLHLPPHLPDQAADQRKEAIDKLYEKLPDVPALPAWNPDLAGRPLTLESLQTLALENSPVLRQATADAEAARGAMIQAGAYPNPELGYEADTVNTANTKGYHGGYVQQTFVTGGKLRLAQAAAAVELENARLALRKSRVQVATAVRSAYFAALVARERLKLAQALAQFTEQIYQAQIDLVEGGESAAYEPMQLRVLSLQAHAAVVQAQQQYQSQWRKLAAAVGLPDLAPTQVQGRADMPAPRVDYDRALATMLANQTALAIAANSIGQAGYLLRLAEVTPLPNIDTYLAVQHDFTFNPGTTTYNLQVGGQIPVFNRNRGNIISAQAQLYRAEQTVEQVRNDLIGNLADAFARYEASRVLIESFRAEALRDQVRAYRGIYERYRNDPVGVQFNDVVVAQQTLAATLTQYIDILGDQWQAVVDLAELMQVDDLYTLGAPVEVPPIPDLEEIPRPH